MSKRGVTLIELLIVVSILGVLSLVGVATYSGIQKNTRDTKRRADVTQITKTYEVHYDPLKNEYYPLEDDWFSSGKPPTPPEGGLYNGLLGATSTKGFQICAVLETDNPDFPTACSSPSSTCFCKQSTRTTYTP